MGLLWVGCLSLLPFIGDVMWSGESDTGYAYWFHRSSLPVPMAFLGYAAAYLPVLAFAAIARKKESVWMFVSAAWVAVLGLLSHYRDASRNPWIYLWVGLGACALCLWGVRDNRKLFINYGIALFALNVITFYFSEVLDKLGRSMGDRKSTRLNSSHGYISYAVFCLKKKKYIASSSLAVLRLANRRRS